MGEARWRELIEETEVIRGHGLTLEVLYNAVDTLEAANVSARDGYYSATIDKAHFRPAIVYSRGRFRRRMVVVKEIRAAMRVVSFGIPRGW